MHGLSTPLKEVLGLATAKALDKAFELRTVEDLLRHYPNRYVKRGEFSTIKSLKPGDEVTIVAKVLEIKQRFGKGKRWLEVVVGEIGRAHV